MSKQLYEEALADVKRVKEVAEDNARRAVLEAVTPRIRELIERSLLNESDDLDDIDESMPTPPGAPPGLGSSLDVSVNMPPGVSVSPAVSQPDEDGKVVLDIDTLCDDQDSGEEVPAPQFGAQVPAPETDEFEVSMESVDALSKIASVGSKGRISIQMATIAETVRSLGITKPSKERSTQIAETISRVEDMYDHVQTSIKDQALKASIEAKLEAHFKNLNKLQEQTMSKVNSKVQQLGEADVTLKLTGLQDDIDIDSVGVDLVTGEEDEEGGDLEGMGDEDLSGGDDELDLGGDEGGQPQMETLSLSDDTIVEIDENMLRQEIARMKALREETEPQSWGNGVGAKEMDDFGGADEEGEPLDVKVRDVAKVSQPLGEADEDLDELDQVSEVDEELDEADDMDELAELQNRRRSDTYGSDVANSHETGTWDKRKHESLQRRAAGEAKLQSSAKAKAAQLKKEAKTTRSAKRLAELKQVYGQVAQRFNESLARSKKISKLLASSAKLQKEAAKNGSSTRLAGSKAEDQLRAKLAETNLFNAKLLYTNKLLQNESLTAKQKSQIIKRLDEAKTLREVKLVYEGLSEKLSNKSQIRESADRKVMGSASTTTRSASSQSLNENAESARWAKLAGITK